MSQKQAERGEERAEKRGVEEAQGQAANPSPPPPLHTPHTHPSLNLSLSFTLPSLTHPQQAKHHQGSPGFFLLHHLTLIPYFLPSLPCSLSVLLYITL